MTSIYILGAGLSSTVLINYLIEHSEKYDWQIVLGDTDLRLAQKKVNKHPRAKAFQFDVLNPLQVEEVAHKADIVVSMLPARFHAIIAKFCIKYKKNLLTASYISPEIEAMQQDALEAGIGIFMELGVDPGIDHMSAMRVIDRLKSEGAQLTAFFSGTGGLIAPQSDNNPWNYKFTWNPRNVVVAGQGTSMYIEKGQNKYVPYQRLFKNTLTTSIDEYGDFEIYPNRDSLKYRNVYGIENIPTLLRGTMRRKGYSQAWDVFVQLGMTDDTYRMEKPENFSFRDFVNSFLPYSESESVEEKLKTQLPELIDNTVLKKLKWLDIFESISVPKEAQTPAQILQFILERKWILEAEDKDMIAMQHQFEYIRANGSKGKLISSLVVIGKNQSETAMAITVGTPLAIAVKKVALGQFTQKGIQVPVKPEMYLPILEELEQIGITFNEIES